MEKEFKVLTHCGVYVDSNLLAKGIYTTSVPNIYGKNETIENLVERALLMKDMTGTTFIPQSYLDNLKLCKLTDVVLEIKKE